MNVLAWGGRGSLARARQDGYAVAPSKEAMFEQSDVLSLHVRLYPPRAGWSPRQTSRA